MNTLSIALDDAFPPSPLPLQASNINIEGSKIGQ